MAKHQHFRHARGFTLIELLVAISILAIIAVLGWRGLDGIVRARIALTQNMEQSRSMQLVFAQLQSDCAQIVRPRDIANRMALAAEPSRITLVRTVFGDNQAVALKVVAYRINNGVLSRRESATTRDLRELDGFWRTQLGDIEIDNTQAVALQTDVAELNLRLWMEKGTAWQTPAPISTAATGPAATAGVIAAAAAANPLPDSATPIGLEVAMQLRDKPAVITKVFLLGAV
ncbi:MAG: prepilin-type N-terminal cleavage/methylation domain-containing protein [Pseudomonadota bacterium]